MNSRRSTGGGGGGDGSLGSGRTSRHQGKLFAAAEGSDPSHAGGAQENGTDGGAPRSALVAQLEEQLGREEASELQEMFKLVDKDGGGSISQTEFIELLHTMSVRPSPLEMDLMYGELDVDQDGVIEYAEFLKFMCEPGVQSANGTALLQAFRHIEAMAHDRGVAHPPAAGKTGRHGLVAHSELAHALRTYLPDKVRSERDVNDLLQSVPYDKRSGLVDYQAYVRAHTLPHTMPPRDEKSGEYIMQYPAKVRRTRAVIPVLQIVDAASEAAAAAAAATAAESGGEAAPAAETTAAAGSASARASQRGTDAAAAALASQRGTPRTSPDGDGSASSSILQPAPLGAADALAGLLLDAAASARGLDTQGEMAGLAASIGGADVHEAQVEAHANEVKGQRGAASSAAKKKQKSSVAPAKPKAKAAK